MPTWVGGGEGRGALLYSSVQRKRIVSPFATVRVRAAALVKPASQLTSTSAAAPAPSYDLYLESDVVHLLLLIWRHKQRVRGNVRNANTLELESRKQDLAAPHLPQRAFIIVGNITAKTIFATRTVIVAVLHGTGTGVV